MSSTDKYCVYPFNYPHIGHQGTPALCCNNAEYKLPYNIRTDRLIDIWHSPEAQAVRDQFQSGGIPAGCEFCTVPESQGVRSFRQKTLGNLNRNVPFADYKIHALDLRIGNACNLACIMCSSNSSIQLWRKLPELAENYGWSSETLGHIIERTSPELQDWSQHESSWENIYSSIGSDLRHVYIAGGEPFYVNNFEDILHRMMMVAPNARYVINSNGTRLFPAKDLNRFSGRKLAIRLSIDGLAGMDEYIRQGTEWEHKVAVMRQYHQHFEIECWDLTLNSLCVRKAPELITWLQTEFPDVKINVRPVVNNRPMQLYRIPDTLRADVLQWFLDHRELAWGSDNVINELRKPYQEHKQKLRQVVGYWDKQGNNTLAELDSELAQWLWSE